MTTRKYSSRAQQTTLSSSITSTTATTMVVVSGASLMGGKTPAVGETYTVVINPDTAQEEIVDVSNYTSGNTLTIARGIDGPTPGTGNTHSAGAVVRHMIIGRDLNEANTHIENTTTAHGITLANIVQTGTTGTVDSAMILDGTIVNADINASAAIVDTKLATISTASKVSNSATTAASANTASAIVARDASGNFTAGTVTANLTGNVTGNVTGNLTGTASAATLAATATALATGRTISLTGDVTGTSASFDGTGNASITAAIAANTIVDADINASAAIALSKLASDPLARANHTGTQLAATVSDFDTQVRTSRLDQMTAPTGDVAFNAQKITGLADPTLAQDAATKAYTDTQITNLINAAPGALDTLDELAAALGDDASFSTTVTNSLAAKLPLAGGTMSGALAMGTNKITGLGDPTLAQDAATKNYIDTASIAPSNLTGPITSVGPATSIASQTGTGTKFVVDTSPTLVTPVLGVATATSINGTTIPSSKTLVATDSTAYVVPSQTSNSGKYLTTDGTTSSWGVVDALPSQTGNSGKFLTTNGTAASWSVITTDPTPTVFMLMGA
jgi:trimeric autotransporter adhesin